MDITKLKATPSRNADFKSAGPVNIRTEDGALIASTMNPENGRDNAADAAELVRRYNEFPRLVEALKDAEWLLEGTVSAKRNTIADDEVLAKIRAILKELAP